MASRFSQFFRKAVAFFGIGIAPSASRLPDASIPLITSGSAAASASDPNGSLYLRTAGENEVRVGGAWRHLPAANVIADPGDGEAIPVTHSGVCALTSAGAETRTLAIPTYLGQRIVLVCDTYVGDIVLTVAAAVNVANNNTLTFGAVSEVIELVGVSVGGSLVWQVGFNDGVGLTTV